VVNALNTTLGVRRVARRLRHDRMNARVPGRLPVPAVTLRVVCEPCGSCRGRPLATELLVSFDGFLEESKGSEDRGQCHPDSCPDSQCLFRCGRCGG
jgi:hypothetical protein